MEKLKKCLHCNTVKEYSFFYKNKAKKDGLEYKCKECINKDKRKYYEENKDELSIQHKKYYEDNKDERKKHYEENKDEIAIQHKKYYEENKEYIRNRNVNYYNKKRKTDLIFKFKNNIRALIRNSIKYKGYSKTTRTYKILGCDYDTLLNHLNDNRYGFVYGEDEYDVDHMIPLSSVKTEAEVVALNHYTNLQLLPSEFNRYIKKDKVMTLEEMDTELLNWLSKNT